MSSQQFPRSGAPPAALGPAPPPIPTSGSAGIIAPAATGKRHPEPASVGSGGGERSRGPRPAHHSLPPRREERGGPAGRAGSCRGSAGGEHRGRQGGSGRTGMHLGCPVSARRCLSRSASHGAGNGVGIVIPPGFCHGDRFAEVTGGAASFPGGFIPFFCSIFRYILH